MTAALAVAVAATVAAAAAAAAVPWKRADTAKAAATRAMAAQTAAAVVGCRLAVDLAAGKEARTRTLCLRQSAMHLT